MRMSCLSNEPKYADRGGLRTSVVKTITYSWIKWKIGSFAAYIQHQTTWGSDRNLRQLPNCYSIPVVLLVRKGRLIVVNTNPSDYRNRAWASVQRCECKRRWLCFANMAHNVEKKFSRNLDQTSNYYWNRGLFIHTKTPSGEFLLLSMWKKWFPAYRPP